MSEDLWTVGALARLVGVSPDSIRHYERIGILPKAARSRAGYRFWPRRDVEYMKWVGPARRAGFTLRELARVFQMYRSGVAPCDTVRGLLERKLAELDAEITHLVQFRQELSRAHRGWQERHSKHGEFVHLLDDLHELASARRPGWLGFGKLPSPARRDGLPAGGLGDESNGGRWPAGRMNLLRRLMAALVAAGGNSNAAVASSPLGVRAS